MRWRGAFTTLGACLFAVAANAEPLKTYQSSAYRWAITYPAGWRLDASLPNAVLITSDEIGAMCGVHAGAVRFDNAGSFADFMLSYMAEDLRQRRGLQSETLWRRDIRLRTGQPAVEALVALSPGGMSHRLFAVVSHDGVGVDCEADEANWPRVTKEYDQILASFGVAQR